MNSSRVLISLANKATKQFWKNNSAKYSTAMTQQNYKSLSITVPKEYVYHVELNRPAKLNALTSAMWHDFGKCFEELGQNPECRVIVLSAAGKLFTAGIDLNDAMSLGQKTAEHDDIARKSKVLRDVIKKYQDAFTAMEKKRRKIQAFFKPNWRRKLTDKKTAYKRKMPIIIALNNNEVLECEKPVIAAVHGACVGAGIDMITAADIRYCTKDAWFQIKEVDLGMAADVGTLQRFPKVIGSDGLARELAYTARKFNAQEALGCGFVNRVFDNKEQLLSESIAIAEQISKKSPVAVQGTKLSMVYSRDHTVQEGLDHIAQRNEAMLQSEDFLNAAVALATKRDQPTFSKL